MSRKETTHHEKSPPATRIPESRRFLSRQILLDNGNQSSSLLPQHKSAGAVEPKRMKIWGDDREDEGEMMKTSKSHRRRAQRLGLGRTLIQLAIAAAPRGLECF